MSNDNILNNISYLESKDLDTFIDNLITTNRPASLGFVNQHSINLMHSDETIYEQFLSLSFLLRDGIGVKLACKYKGIDPKDNLNGTDFIPKIINAINKSDRDVNFFAFGTSEPWLSEGAFNLFKTEDVITENGFQDEDVYIKNFKLNAQENSLNCVVLAMGMPKQEKIALLLSKIQVPSLIICGGAIIDFQAGKVKRSPEILRKLGLEWLYRLLTEPGRLFKRYVVGIPKFFYHLIVN
ncbi:MAG: WecB/TagA/CpsF family glycosyltransferase [Pseudomonadota bacterium]|nr:WecB/TagA/CpsF family glycosyltransferase [Pseudomonadota bacterium]